MSKPAANFVQVDFTKSYFDTLDQIMNLVSIRMQMHSSGPDREAWYELARRLDNTKANGYVLMKKKVAIKKKKS